jgi:hypothetical protein
VIRVLSVVDAYTRKCFACQPESNANVGCDRSQAGIIVSDPLQYKTPRESAERGPRFYIDEAGEEASNRPLPPHAHPC